MVVSEESVLRRFHDLHSMSQETVEIQALWIIHYKDKASIDLIVDVWQRCFLTSSDAQRVTLFYIMNHAVQSAKSKHLDYVISAFQPAVLASIPLGRSSPEVRHVIERCLDLFESRNVFTKASVATMKCILEKGDAADPIGGLEFNHAELCNKIEAFDKARSCTEGMMEAILSEDMKDISEYLKSNPRDRQHAYNQMKEAEIVLNSIITMRHSMEAQKKKQLELVESLVLAQRFLGNTFNDSISVDNAYQSYYQSLKNVQKELMDMERTGIYPAATPPRDAPSPTANDDIYATGVENAVNHLRGPVGRANLETADMDVDDDEPEPAQTVPFPMDFSVPPPVRQPDASTAWAANSQPLVSPGVSHNYALPPPIIPTIPQGPPNLVSPSALPKPQLISPPLPGQAPSDPRQMGQPRVFNVPPPSIVIPPPQLNQLPPLNLTSPQVNQPLPSNLGQGALRDPRQVNQRTNNNPPPRAPYNMPQESVNPNRVPLGVRDAAPDDAGGFRAPYKQDPSTSATEEHPVASFHSAESSSSHREGFQRDRERGHESNGSWRNDDRHGGQRHGHERYDDRRGRFDDRDRRNWDRDRGDGWNRRDSGGHRYNDNRRDRGSFSRDRDRNSYRGSNGYDRGSQM